MKEVFEEPQVQHLGILKKVTSKQLGEQTLMGQPVTLSAHALDHRARGAEARRAHEEILAEIGYDREDLARMKAAGVY